ncbi:hypothetical protein FA13DRAFT_1804623 [Coprinellus micaceus]|uniref:F-box domain-containing protein n=1 Tax=Coprinellus micaceus TaxID=71717 RepID=A0A4Y7S5A2_COPMI|nr:hypothetical protein FA13DRAFT_1804623 [Coprinellus micaceus]
MVTVLRGRLSIPPEVAEDIGFSLLASCPLHSLAAIIPLLQTSKEWHTALSPKSNTTLYARLCRLKFDIAAVERRAFTPTNADLTAHLIEACRTLKTIRNGDIFHEDVDSVLLNVLVMMFHDDGKNRTQLEFSGVVDFVDQFSPTSTTRREGDQRHVAIGERTECSCPVAVVAFDYESLRTKPFKRGPEIINLVLPFLVCPMRYASAYAPSNHFILPLTEEVQLFETSTRHGPFPVYHMKQQKATVIPFFHSRTSVLIPPVSAAATLLFWSRREIQPFFQIPTGVPTNRDALGGNPGLTLEDLVDFNSFKAAKLRSVVRWDWDQGCPMSLLEDGSMDPCIQEPSKRWDMDWWRSRMCQSVFWKQPEWRLGNVYKRGLLTGLWQGVYFVLRNSSCPDVVSGSFQLLPRPILMRLQEHSFVSGAGISQAATETRKPPRTPHQPAAIPPISSSATQAKEDGEDHLIPDDPNINNAWIPGPIGGLKWSSDHETTLVPSAQRPQDPLAAPPGSARSVDPMPSMSFRIASASACHPPRPSSNDNRTYDAQDGRPFAQYNGYYLYETFEPGKAMPDRVPRCPRCEVRQKYLDEVRRRERQGESVIPEPMVDDKVEGFFKNIGMGRNGDGSFDLNLTQETAPTRGAPNRPPHDFSRAEVCDDGIVDTIVTGGLDEHHRLAWGDSVYYGRVRPWDGMVAILRRHGPNDMRNHGQFLFYGYVYGGDTFVGNWRYAGGDPTTPAFEAPFIMSRRAEDPLLSIAPTRT